MWSIRTQIRIIAPKRAAISPRLTFKIIPSEEPRSAVPVKYIQNSLLGIQDGMYPTACLAYRK